MAGFTRLAANNYSGFINRGGSLPVFAGFTAVPQLKACRRNEVAMFKNNKAAGCGDTQAAESNFFESHFSRLLLAFKARCVQVAAWLSVVGVGLW